MKFNFKKSVVAFATAMLVGCPAITAFAQPSYEEINQKWETVQKDIKQVAVEGSGSLSIGQNGQLAELGTVQIKGEVDITTWEGSGEIDILSAFLPAPQKLLLIVKENKGYVFEEDQWQVEDITDQKEEFLKIFQEVFGQASVTQADSELQAKTEKYLDITTEGDMVKVAWKSNIDAKTFYQDFEEVFEMSKEIALEAAQKQDGVISDEQLELLNSIYSEETITAILSKNPKYEVTFNAEGQLVRVTFEIVVDVNDFVPTEEDAPSMFQVKGDFEMKYNQPVTVEVPAEAEQ